MALRLHEVALDGDDVDPNRAAKDWLDSSRRPVRPRAPRITETDDGPSHCCASGSQVDAGTTPRGQACRPRYHRAGDARRRASLREDDAGRHPRPRDHVERSEVQPGWPGEDRGREADFRARVGGQVKPWVVGLMLAAAPMAGQTITPGRLIAT